MVCLQWKATLYQLTALNARIKEIQILLATGIFVFLWFCCCRTFVRILIIQWGFWLYSYGREQIWDFHIHILTQWMVVTQSCRKSPVSGNKGHKSSNRCIYICILVIKSLTYCVKYENYSAWMLISSIGDHYVPVQPKNKSDNFCGIIRFKIRILNNSISYNWHIVYYKYINMYL